MNKDQLRAPDAVVQAVRAEVIRKTGVSLVPLHLGGPNAGSGRRDLVGEPR